MTEYTAAPPRASAFEDYVDILYAPSTVFARRRDASPWVPLLIITGLFAIATYLSYTFLGPIFEAEAVRQAMRQQPDLPAEALAGMRRFVLIMAMVSGVLLVPFTTLFLGVLLWIVGKLLDADQPLRSAFLVVVFSFVPRVIEALVGVAQAFVMDVNAVQSVHGITFSAARLMSPDTPDTLLALASRLNPFILWSYLIIGIGLAVTGRISRGRGLIAAAILWLVGALPAALPALMGR